jgi:phosphoenolpyruvate carboxylase
MQQGHNPVEILEEFFRDQKDLQREDDQIGFMFRVIQYIERQIVLIDALEDAAYDQINDLTGVGSFKNLADRIQQEGRMDELSEELSHFSVRAVLTAHPTQFYPGEVLGIITDLADAIEHNQLEEIRMLLQQLGKTPFFKKKKPTPLDEAASLIWFLENIFYVSAPQLVNKIMHVTQHKSGSLANQSLLSFGFWPGGDRDGNPFVDTETTLKVAARLKFSIIRNYYRDVRKLRRKLTFKGVIEKLQSIENTLFQYIIQADESLLSFDILEAKLLEVEQTLIEQHDSLFIDSLITFKNKLKLFGFHFATIDFRQDSRVIQRTIDSIHSGNPELELNAQNSENQFDHLLNIKGNIASLKNLDEIELDTVNSFPTILQIQKLNGIRGCHRYIISNCRNEVDVSNVFALARLNGWETPFELDIIPLFETINDLENAGSTMTKLYEHPVYRAHLCSRGGQQTIMLGFSDGTKDGGYLSANWNIYKAKENLTRVSREAGIDVVFFDGRGGPPARGGGNTHRFYASHGPDIENKEVQLTIQGQTISSNFGTPVSAAYNLELLMSAGLENQLIRDQAKILGPEAESILINLSKISYDEYQRFKSHPKFVPYLEKMSALKYYGMAKIGSRPSKRKASKELRFEDLRAIPFVGAWSQLKQNVPGFFGVGTALKTLEENGQLDRCVDLYKHNGFFKALIENSMMSLTKTFFPLTAHMKDDPEFGSFWNWIYKEYQLAKEMVLKVSGQSILLESNEKSRESIALREKIILPLVIIQQYALMQVRQMELSGEVDEEKLKVLQKLIVRSLYGNINASRNSA